MKEQKLNFQFLDKELEVHISEDNEPLFVAAEVCEILGINNVSQTISYLKPYQKLTSLLMRSGQKRKTNMLKESGLYSLVLKSRKPEAEKFQEWVTTEVLPSIRKHGMYADEDVLEKGLTDPEYVIRVFTKLKEEKEARAKAEKEKEIAEESARLAYNKIVEDKPKVEFADLILESKDSIDVGTFATRLVQQGYDTGRNRMYKTLMDNGYLIKNGPRRRQPKVNFVGMGIFEVKTSVYNDKVTYQTLITPKGQKYLMERILEK